MATPGTQYMMQACLAADMSSSPHPKPVDPYLSDPVSMLPPGLTPDSNSRITLRGVSGKDVLIPCLSIGAWSWGDKATFDYNPTRDLPRIHAAWAKLKAVGLTFVDTAQSYGDGESERICGILFRDMPRDSFVVQTKWLSTPDITNTVLQSGGPKSKLKDSLVRLQLDYVDIYLVQGPIHPSKISIVAKGMAGCVKSGMARAVGVANYDTNEMIKMADELAKHDVPLSVCQCEYSVVRRLPEVTEGRLSGKYSTFNEPQQRRRFSSYPMRMLEPTINVLKSIAEERHVSVPAVALNYSINKGVLPLVGVRDAGQAEQDMQALGWRLTEDEIKQIEGVSLQGRRSSFMQHG
ncbi:hypothetical protein DTO013E5_1488 [Penicillium roqueforti]|nr:uncharacterized protein LCP9604111_4959 [Penicillium roqueforti]KAF9248720.1 hypothetical protein LCP9604111_4959 [Penicillium roqueforti]KAI2681725.1 hypothetical protein CBS147355_2935 [Penicillium roqueforti]KAI2689115.1 hypothetical protein LCP963914a_2204 [Penicillium roqueforti]KAI2703829.1 hypothetical protein CBS147372_2298 [Penicillium roqueforti]KAI2709324.1 hypothetical protein CBS147354_8961 [Penicillium roqueforti]